MSRQKNIPCVLCGVLMWGGTTSLPDAARVCKDCRRTHPLHTVPLPPEGVQTNRSLAGPKSMRGSCAVCTRPMVRKRDAPPDKVQVCHPCRRAAPGRAAAGSLPQVRAQHPLINHVCLVCSSPFTARSKTAKYCTAYCRFVARDGRTPRRTPTIEERRHYERNRPSTTDRGYGSDWMKARQAVLAEESTCGFCGDLVDKTLQWPHPMSPSVDHIVRKRDGGTHARDNLRLAHVRCNASDGGRAHGTPRFDKPCEICGGPFRASHSKQRTCSTTCGWVLRRRNAA